MKQNSAAVLRSIWERFATQYEEHRGRPTSMRETCHLLDFDSSALAKWTTIEAPVKKRVPIRHLPALREMLMMTDQEYDQLMEARLAELESDNETVIACTWLVKTLTPELQDGPMDNEEIAVLQAFRKAHQKRPRGLYFDSDEPGLLKGVLDQILKRAQRLHEEGEASDAYVPIPQEKLEAAVNQLKASAPKQRQQRKEHFLAERKRIKDELCNRRVKARSNA